MATKTKIGNSKVGKKIVKIIGKEVPRPRTKKLPKVVEKINITPVIPTEDKYRALTKGEVPTENGRYRLNYEIRQYDPMRRTIIIGHNKFWYLPFPYLYFGRFQYEYNYEMEFKNPPFFAVGFMSKKVGRGNFQRATVYFPPLTHVDYNMQICLGAFNGKDFDAGVKAFFMSQFSDFQHSHTVMDCLRKTFGSLEEWSQMTFEEVLKRTKQSKDKQTIKNLVGDLLSC